MKERKKRKRDEGRGKREERVVPGEEKGGRGAVHSATAPSPPWSLPFVAVQSPFCLLSSRFCSLRRITKRRESACEGQRHHEAVAAVASHQAVIIVLPGAVSGAVSCRICCWKSGGDVFFQMANNCKQRRSFSDPQSLKDDGDNDCFFR
ncbi:uncharacterized protein DS421_18g618590 [Arachis hypogaea]|nr:uncharacterized protein DS421_18g618590 [Arachis hypogaea]